MRVSGPSAGAKITLRSVQCDSKATYLSYVDDPLPTYGHPPCHVCAPSGLRRGLLQGQRFVGHPNRFIAQKLSQRFAPACQQFHQPHRVVTEQPLG